ncbi:hypothetical protein [Maribacter dokdonensis]|uniref:PD-(D/E)XK nuclease domain-containing protein n=1 Tax=Maribacter dokdonensis TaxID=320912 RepID=UPI002736489B|nr:hypothetical protein [Maribacter dokdonensis]MDP2525641.1 hypothetical protein [Maribacter dokdonensis]
MSDQNYQELKISESVAICRNHISKVQSLHEELSYCEPMHEQYISKEIDQELFEFKSKFRTTYFLVLTYLQTKGNLELLMLFKDDLQKDIIDDNIDITSQYIEEIDEQIYICAELDKLEEYLIPYQAFDKNIFTSLGIMFLENILSNTSLILKELDVKPTNETHVSKHIKFVIKSTFPDSSFPTETFNKTAKCYKPYILIPSLNTAIEYKYAENEKRLITTIEQILIDVVGYSNHPKYKIFYAVFYVKVGTFSENRFNIIWKESKFPSNWKPIFVSGE